MVDEPLPSVLDRVQRRLPQRGSTHGTFCMFRGEKCTFDVVESRPVGFLREWGRRCGLYWAFRVAVTRDVILILSCGATSVRLLHLLRDFVNGNVANWKTSCEMQECLYL